MLRVAEVDRPVPEYGQVLVRVKAAGINPGEATIRTGAMADIFPSTFPSGQGSDLAGVVAEVGAGVDRFVVGDEVIGFSERRAAEAELVLVDVDNLTPKPDSISWEVAGGLYVAAVTAWGAVHSIQLDIAETVVISAAAGGVGSLRRSHKWSAARIAFELSQQDVPVSRRTVSRVLAQLQLNRRRFIDPSGESKHEPQQIVARRPGHMVHIDVKKVGRIPAAAAGAGSSKRRTPSAGRNPSATPSARTSRPASVRMWRCRSRGTGSRWRHGIRRSAPDSPRERLEPDLSCREILSSIRVRNRPSDATVRRSMSGFREGLRGPIRGCR